MVRLGGWRGVGGGAGPKWLMVQGLGRGDLWEGKVGTGRRGYRKMIQRRLRENREEEEEYEENMSYTTRIEGMGWGDAGRTRIGRDVRVL